MKRWLKFRAPADSALNFELAERYRGGDRAARDEMLERNLCLIDKTAKWFWRSSGGDHGPFDFWDLFHEGVIGVAKAIESYDPSFRRPFSGFAKTYIFAAIVDYVSHGQHPIRVPNYLQANKRTKRRFAGDAEKVMQAEFEQVDPELHEDSRSVKIEAYSDQIDLRDSLRRLSDTERKVIAMRYWEGRSLKDIAIEMGFGTSGESGQVVRRIEDRAIHQLRKSFGAVA